VALLKEVGLVPLEYKKAYYNRLENADGKLLWLSKTPLRKKAGLKDYEVS
jgi:hypothetical protein